jgi:hypothetical protein
MQGLAKKNTTPEGWRFFLSQLAKPLQGAKSLLSKKQSEHRFPALTLTLGSEHRRGSETKKLS